AAVLPVTAGTVVARDGAEVVVWLDEQPVATIASAKAGPTHAQCRREITPLTRETITVFIRPAKGVSRMILHGKRPRADRYALLFVRRERAIARLCEAPSGLLHRVGYRAVLLGIAGKDPGRWILGVEPRLFRHAFDCRGIALQPEVRGHVLPHRGGQVGIVDAEAPSRIG